MPTIHFSLSRMNAIPFLWSLSTIDDLWMHSEKGSDLCEFVSMLSANTGKNTGDRIIITLSSDTRRASDPAPVANISDAALLATLFKRCGVEASYKTSLSKWAVRVISRDMSSKK